MFIKENGGRLIFSFTQKKNKKKKGMKNSSRSRSLDPTLENERLKTELQSKTEELDRTNAEFNQMKVKYQDLLRLAGTHDLSSSSEIADGVSGVYNKNSQSIEIQQWNQMWTRCVGMATQVLVLPQVPSSTDDQKRAVLIDIVSKLCDRIKHPEQMESFKSLKKKYSKSKKNLFNLNQRCMQLMDMVHKNAKVLEDYIQEANTNEKENFSEKLEELGEILAEQLKQEEALIRESTIRKGNIKSAMRSMKKSYVGSSDSDYEDSSDSDDVRMKKKHHGGGSGKGGIKVKATRQQLFGDSSDDSEEDARLRKIKQQLSKLGIDDLSDDSDDDRKHSHRHKKKTSVSIAERKRNLGIFSDSDDADVDEPDSSDDERIRKHHSKVMAASRRQRSVPNDYTSKKTRRYDSDSDSDGGRRNDDDSYDEDDETQRKIKAILNRKKTTRYVDSSDEERRSDDDNSDDEPRIKVAKKNRYLREDAAMLNAELSADARGNKRQASASASFAGKGRKDDQIGALRGKYGNHVNQLVGVTNKFGKKYNRIKREIASSDDEASPSISRISYINDSVVKAKKRATSILSDSD